MEIFEVVFWIVLSSGVLFIGGLMVADVVQGLCWPRYPEKNSRLQKIVRRKK